MGALFVWFENAAYAALNLGFLAVSGRRPAGPFVSFVTFFVSFVMNQPSPGTDPDGTSTRATNRPAQAATVSAPEASSVSAMVITWVMAPSSIGGVIGLGTK